MGNNVRANVYGLTVAVRDREKAAEWLCSNLFFEKEGPALRSGCFRILLEEDPCAETDGQMHIGFQHVSLETHDIGEAISYCQSRGMRLELGENGGPRFSDKVYGTGMYYFNILTDFGLTVEVSQKLHKQIPPGEHMIWGLEHIGLQVPDLYEAVAFYEAHGFKREFDPVINTPPGHRVICCMVSGENGVIELYEFDDLPDLTREANAPIRSLIVSSGEERTPVCGAAGERIVFVQTGHECDSIQQRGC